MGGACDREELMEHVSGGAYGREELMEHVSGRSLWNIISRMNSHDMKLKIAFGRCIRCVTYKWEKQETCQWNVGRDGFLEIVNSSFAVYSV